MPPSTTAQYSGDGRFCAFATPEDVTVVDSSTCVGSDASLRVRIVTPAAPGPRARAPTFAALLASGAHVLRLERRNVAALDFSPNSNYLVTWERPAGDGAFV